MCIWDVADVPPKLREDSQITLFCLNNDGMALRKGTIVSSSFASVADTGRLTRAYRVTEMVVSSAIFLTGAFGR